MRRRPDWPTLAGLLAILLWSTTFALARSIAVVTGPLTAGAAVFMLGGAAYTAAAALRSGGLAVMFAAPRAYLLGCGALFVAYVLALYLAIGTAGDDEQTLAVALVNYLWPTLTIVFSVRLVGNRATALLLPGTAVALAGVALPVASRAGASLSAALATPLERPLPVTLALIAAVTWALYSNLARRWGAGEAGAVPLFVLSSGIVLLLVRVMHPEPSHWTLRAAIEVAALALATVLGYGCWDLAMRRGDMVLVASASYLTPLLSTVATCAYLGVAPAPTLWLACLLVVAGSALSRRGVRPAAGAAAANARGAARRAAGRRGRPHGARPTPPPR